MTPKLAVYLYPWDLARIGVNHVLDDLERNEVSAVDLAATYHVITAVSPRDAAMRVFFAPRGGVFFPARTERYARIKPSVWPDRSVTDIWEGFSKASVKRSIELNAWTITMFQPWMAQDFPFAARVLPTGDRSDSGVCPNSPDVQEYLGIYAADISEQFPIHYFSLEGNCIPGFDYGWLRPRRLVGLTGIGRALLRLCFCESCTTLATKKGIHIASLRQRTLELLAKFGVRSANVEAPPPDEIFEGDEELFAYSRLGSDGAEAVVKSMNDAVASKNPKTGIVIAAPEMDLGGYGARLENVIDQIAGIHVGEFASFEEQLSFVTDLRNRAPRLLVNLLFPPPLVPSTPTITPSFDYEAPEYLTRTQNALGLGLDQITIYHYSLLDDEEFQLVRRSLGFGSNE